MGRHPQARCLRPMTSSRSHLAVYRRCALLLVVAVGLLTMRMCDASSATAAVVEWPCVGIDLGTTYSVVGVWQHGAVQIIPNELGNRITPSVVAFTDAERLVGDGAKHQMQENPRNTVYAVKRLIGRKFADPVVQKDRALLSYHVAEDKDGRPRVEVSLGGRVNKQFTPEEISAMVLLKMKEIAETYLGERVKNAVVTVPAYFNDAQRQSTKDAGTIAGLNVVRIINEPTAAAIAYGLNKQDGEKNVLVFDLGGGTFDVSLLTIEDGFFEVVATNGDTHLGGEDFDNNMLQYFLATIKKKYGVDVAGHPHALAKLRKACEAAKRQLSSQPEARVEVDSLVEGFDMSEKITRSKFEELNMALFKGTLEPVRMVLEDATLKTGDIDEIVLVGGSTRIPKVRQLVRDFFKKEPNAGINPDEAVAFGAAVQAGVLMGDANLTNSVLMVDIVPLSLGIETVGGVMAKLVHRNVQIPVRKSQVFSTHQDKQRSVLIQIYEGERAMTKDNRLLGQFELSGIAEAPRGGPQIEVTFDIDENSILHVSATEKSTNSREELSVTNLRGSLTQEEVDRMVGEAAAFEEEDRQLRDKVEARNALEAAVSTLRRAATDKGHRIGAEERQTVNDALREATEYLDENPSASAEQYNDARATLQRAVGAIAQKLAEPADVGSSDEASEGSQDL